MAISKDLEPLIFKKFSSRRPQSGMCSYAPDALIIKQLKYCHLLIYLHDVLKCKILQLYEFRILHSTILSIVLL
jgi:hypothetical protein